MHVYHISLSDFHWMGIGDNTYITHGRLNSCLIWLFTASPSPHVLCTLLTSVSDYPSSPFKCPDGRTVICNVFELHSIFSKQMCGPKLLNWCNPNPNHVPESNGFDHAELNVASDRNIHDNPSHKEYRMDAVYSILGFLSVITVSAVNVSNLFAYFAGLTKYTLSFVSYQDFECLMRKNMHYLNTL